MTAYTVLYFLYNFAQILFEIKFSVSYAYICMYVFAQPKRQDETERDRYLQNGNLLTVSFQF